jgi:hypothetical protein
MKKKISLAVEENLLERLEIKGEGNKSKGLEELNFQFESLVEFAQSVEQYLELENLEDMKRLIAFELHKIRGIL